MYPCIYIYVGISICISVCLPVCLSVSIHVYIMFSPGGPWSISNTVQASLAKRLRE